MPLKLVVDTNLVISAHLSPDSLERLVLNLALSTHVVWYVTSAILTEYEEVLHRKKFKFDQKLIERSLSLIKKRSILVVPKLIITASVDPDDNAFLECAAEAEAHYLVTGNKKHFPGTWEKTQVVNAHELVGFMIRAFVGPDQ